MNNSINYGSFVDLLISSDDDYEPYGLSSYPDMADFMENQSEFEPLGQAHYERAMNQWCGE